MKQMQFRDPELGFAIEMANAQSFDNTHFSEPLTVYAQGLRDMADLDAELDFLAPEVRVGRRFEFRKADAKADFMTDTDDVRESGSDFKVVSYSGEIVQSRTYNKGLTTSIDADDVDDLALEEQTRTALLLRRIKRNDLRRAVTGLLASATNSGKTWGSNTDPDADLMQLCDAAADASGLVPNRIYCGKSAWTKRFMALRASDKAGGFAGAGLTPEQLAALLGLERLMISRAYYQASGTAKAAVTGSYVVAFFALAGLSREDPSHAKRFVSLCADGARYRVYRQEKGPKLVQITVEHYSNIVVTGTAGLQKLTIA